MTPVQFKATIDRNRAALNNLVARKMPILAGNIAKRHIEADFRAGGYTNNGRKPWKPTRRQQYGTGASAAYGPLLSGSNTLASSIQYVPQQASVTIFTRVPYAGIHNWGGTTHPTVTPKMRRYAWAMHYKESGGVKGADTMWKRMALTKRQSSRLRYCSASLWVQSLHRSLTKRLQIKWNFNF